MAAPLRIRWVTILLAGAATVVLVGIAFAIYAAKVSLDAEKTHQVYRIVLMSLTQYIQENPGRWPSDWDELATASSTTEPSHQLSDDLTESRRRVFVDFSVTAADVGAMEVEGFSAVKPIGPSYGPHEGAIQELIAVARRESQKSATPQ